MELPKIICMFGVKLLFDGAKIRGLPWISKFYQRKNHWRTNYLTLLNIYHMKTTISDRIKVCYEQSEARSIRSYALSLGMPESTLRDILKKGVEPKSAFINKFIAANPWLSVEWLMTGEGPMKKDEKLSPSPITAENSIVGDGNNNNSIQSADDSFWKDLVNNLQATISDLRTRCGDFERQNQELQKLLDEERERNKQFPIRYID